MSLPAPLASLSERLFAAWRGGAVSLKAMSFALVGLINTAVDAAIFFLLLAYVTPSLVVANVTAWFIANTGSYVMNSFTTFSAETGGKLSLKHYAGFVGSGLVAVTASTITVVLAAQVHAGLGRQSDRHPGQLRGELHDHALRGVSAPVGHRPLGGYS